MHLSPYDSLEKRLSYVMFVVDANSYERLALWREFQHAVDWKEDSSGFGEVVGQVGDNNVNISLNFATLNGQVVMFIDTISQVVDHRMVDAWLEKHCAPRYDNGHRLARTNSMNFAHCLHAVADASGIPLEHDKCTTLVSVDQEKERAKAVSQFDELTAADPSIVSPVKGWSLRTAFIAGWIAGLRNRLIG
jgi:hypothetical protein